MGLRITKLRDGGDCYPLPLVFQWLAHTRRGYLVLDRAVPHGFPLIMYLLSLINRELISYDRGKYFWRLVRLRSPKVRYGSFPC